MILEGSASSGEVTGSLSGMKPDDLVLTLMSLTFKEVRGSFAILFWLPCATGHSVVTHTHHTHFDRRTLFFATRRQGRSEVS